MKKTELWELLVSLSANEISLAETHDRILRLFNVVERSELLNAFLDYADPIYWGENECTDRKQLIEQFLKSIQ
jgi:hypothetical protein